MLINNNISLKDKILANKDKTIIGYDDFKDRFYAIDSKDRVHALIMGETGSGKSETMKLLMYQHIIKKEGFMLIDPHGMLARDINNILKNELNDYDNKVVYINTEDTNIKINPIEINDYKKYHLVVLSFINALKNLYEYAWGDRLETILRNALLLVIEADPPATLSKIAKVLSNKKYRDMLVKGSGNYDISNYWYHIYPNYAIEAFTAVYNKLDKLLSIASIKQIFDCEESSIDISKLIEENKIIIIDLSSAIADDIIKFLGSLFIHMLYVNAKQNIALNNKYHLYIDEAQLISTFAIREVHEELRNRGFKLPRDIA
ncbi:MAG: hypothetical protein KatS3mg003_2066 [Candidatus Nitrosocaldaceae archaeon]|nr:MAG: hypothetical protein KatS3mg003_2066 [Candidatus Nitrosocaldaceae archaeon]